MESLSCTDLGTMEWRSPMEMMEWSASLSLFSTSFSHSVSDTTTHPQISISGSPHFNHPVSAAFHNSTNNREKSTSGNLKLASHDSTRPSASFEVVIILSGFALLVFVIIVLVWIWMIYKNSETHPPPVPRDIELQPLVRRGVPREEVRTSMFRLPLVRRGVPIEVREEVRTSIVRSTVDPLNSEERCPVCIEEFIEGDRLSTLPPCGHVFHTHCIDVHMGMHTFCPCCRRTISLPYHTHV